MEIQARGGHGMSRKSKVITKDWPRVIKDQRRQIMIEIQCRSKMALLLFYIFPNLFFRGSYPSCFRLLYLFCNTIYLRVQQKQSSPPPLITNRNLLKMPELFNRCLQEEVLPFSEISGLRRNLTRPPTRQ